MDKPKKPVFAAFPGEEARQISRDVDAKSRALVFIQSAKSLKFAGGYARFFCALMMS